MRGAAMSLTAASSGFFFLLLTVTVIQAQIGWGVTYSSTQICASKGSTVDIHCSFRYPYRINYHVTRVEDTFWFTEGSNDDPVALRTDSEYSGRVQYHCNNNHCTLTITDLRESDSGVYKFRFTTNQEGGKYTGEPGVTLSVTDLQVLVETAPAQAELKCHSSCKVADRPPYVWYKNGQNMKKETISLRVSVPDNNNYSCALKGHEIYRSPPVYPPKLPSVSVSPSGQIVEGSSVNLTCSSDANPAAKYTWYKEDEDSPKASGQIFTITDFRPEHSGNYYCEAQNTMGRQRSTLNLTVGAVSWKSAATGSTTAVLLVLILLAVVLLIRRNKSFTQQRQREERPDNREQLNVAPSAAAQRPTAEQQDDLHYASISFSHNQTDVVYSNVRVHPHRETEEDEDGVEYSAVRFNNASSGPGTRCQEDGEVSFALYSTVNQNR